MEPELKSEVTIFFADILGFTRIFLLLAPLEVSMMLDRLYEKLDALSRRHDVYKVETIGDCSMCCTNLILDQPDHCKRKVKFAFDAIQSANETLINPDQPNLGYIDLRVGKHAGPVVANVVRSRNPRYCLFGDSVNCASRMESLSEKNRIQCSDTAHKHSPRDFVKRPFHRNHSRGKLSYCCFIRQLKYLVHACLHRGFRPLK